MSHRVAVTAVVVFWVLTLLAGAAVPGYSIRADYVSSLAGTGSEVSTLGLLALLVLAVAHVMAAIAIGSVDAFPLQLAGIAGVVVAVFRTPCPLGAAGCGSGTNTVAGDPAGLVHGIGVVAYEVALLVGMALIAARLFRTRPLAAAFTVAAGVASVLLALQIDGPDLGLWQRAWLLVNTAWLVVAATHLRPRPLQ